MAFLRKNLKTLLPLKTAIGKPAINGWLGRKAFNRTKGKKFGDLVVILKDEEFMSFCSLIGFVEVTWSMMEQNFDYWVQLIFRKLNGVAIENEPPRAFGKKVKFLRKAFNNIHELQKFKDDAINILDRADSIVDTRHNLTHAVITSMKSDNGRYLLKNFKLDKNAMHTITDFTFDARHFPELSLKLVYLGNDSLAMTDRLLNEFRSP